MIVHHFTFWLFLPTLFVFEIEEVEAGTFHRVSRYPKVERVQEIIELLPKIKTSIFAEKSTYKLKHYTEPIATKYCTSIAEAGREHYVELFYKEEPLDFFCAVDPLTTDGFKEVTHCYGSFGSRTDHLIIKINQHNDINCYHILYEVYYKDSLKDIVDKITTLQFDCKESHFASVNRGLLPLGSSFKCTFPADESMFMSGRVGYQEMLQQPLSHTPYRITTNEEVKMRTRKGKVPRRGRELEPRKMGEWECVC